MRETLADTTRQLAAADTVVHSIDVTGLGSDRSLTQMALSQDLTRGHHEPRVARLLRTRDRRPALDNANNLGRRSPRCSR
jgi:hypothetical protein